MEYKLPSIILNRVDLVNLTRKFCLLGKIILKLFFFRLNKEEYGDLYLEVSEAYSKAGSPDKAIPLLEDLIESEAYNVAAVWLLYGECLAACNRLEDAAKAYENVSNLHVKQDFERD